MTTWYDQAWRQQLAPAQAALLRRARIRSGERIAEVGCGSGVVTFAAAAAAGRKGAAVGIDRSQTLVDRARETARSCGLANVRFERSDGASLPLPAASCDVVFSAFSLTPIRDPRASLAEMARVLRPGGRLVAAVWGRRSHCGWADVFPIVNAHAKSEVYPPCDALGAGDRLSALFHDAGLIDVASERLNTLIEWASSDDAVGGTLIGGPVAPVYSRFDECTRQAVDRAYLESLEPWRVGDAYSIPGEFVIVSGKQR